MKKESDKVDIEYIKKLKKSVSSKYWCGFRECIDLYRFTFSSKYKWEKGYTDFDHTRVDNTFREEYLYICNNGTFREKIYWNYMALYARISRRKLFLKGWYHNTKLFELMLFISYKKRLIKKEINYQVFSRFYQLKIFSVVSCLMLYLKWRGYTVEHSYSDRSESQYLHLIPNELKINYIKIRVSYHKQTINDNSDLFLTLK